MGFKLIRIRTRPVKSPISSPSSSPVVDTLPPFPCLTNDIEREIKAERSIPGTYVVVLKPESFDCLPGYTEDRAGSFFDAKCASTPSSVGGSSACLTPDDPNVVILSRFEDPLSPRFVCRKASPGPLLPLGTLKSPPNANTAYVAQEFPRISSLSLLETPVSTKDPDMAAHRVLEARVYSTIVRLYHALRFYATDLGLRDGRWRMADRGHAGFPPTSRTEKLKQVFGTQNALTHTWRSSGVSYIEQHALQLSEMSRRILQKVWNENEPKRHFISDSLTMRPLYSATRFSTAPSYSPTPSYGRPNASKLESYRFRKLSNMSRPSSV